MTASNVNEPSVDVNAEEPISREQKIANFENLLNEGRKAHLSKEWSLASERLSEASELSVELYGEFAPETFSPHYYYGRTLLELASIERELMDVKENETTENLEHLNELKEELKKVATKIMEATTPEELKPEEQTTDDETKETPTKDDEIVDTKDQTKESAETVELVEDAEDEEEEDEQELQEEEVERSQLAFETLDYARLVCEKQTEKTIVWLKRESEVRILLAQCAMNDGNLEVVIEELTKALEIVRTHFAEDLREIAFICMEMNRANRQAKHFDQASKNLNQAVEAIQKLKDIKQKEIETANEEEKTKLTNLISELNEMIVDLCDEKRMNEAFKMECENKENSESTMATSKMEGTSIELVSYKRKAKDSEVTIQEADEQKKLKLDKEEQEAVA